MYNQITETLERVSPNLFQEGVQWYSKANQFCLDLSNEYNIPLRYVTGLTSLFSPLKSWEMNKRMVKEYLECQNCKTFSYQRKKSVKLWTTIISNIDDEEAQDRFIMKTLNGFKTVSFYHNITYPLTSDKVTIDSHMLKLAPYKHLTPKRYLEYENCIKKIAKEKSLVPNQVQAIIWLKLKDGNTTKRI